jgi:hypothetical protein
MSRFVLPPYGNGKSLRLHLIHMPTLLQKLEAYERSTFLEYIYIYIYIYLNVFSDVLTFNTALNLLTYQKMTRH